jgi:hypothetical protein
VQAKNKAILKSEVVHLVDATWHDAFWLLSIQSDSWTLVDLETKEKVESFLHAAGSKAECLHFLCSI